MVKAEVDRVLGNAWSSKALEQDLADLCSLGGRLAGTTGELAAADLMGRKLQTLLGDVQEQSFRFEGRVPVSSRVRLLDAPGVVVESTPLVGSPAVEEAELEVLDLGRGARDDYIAARGRIAGNAVLVSHEYPFSTGHVHRRLKYKWAKEFGARAFIIAHDLPGCGPISGGTGQGLPDDIPSVGISARARRVMTDAAGGRSPRVNLTIESKHHRWSPTNLIAGVPGRSDECVVLCAHYDGHMLGESAIDNASGVATALQVVRSLREVSASLDRGLRAIFFTTEEWGLVGSKRYVSSLSEPERRRIFMVINLDTVVGSPRLSALTSGRHEVESFVAQSSAGNGARVMPVRPVIANSDHFSFVEAGVPSLRLMAGYEDPGSGARYILSSEDSRDKVDMAQLRVATMTALKLVIDACQAGMGGGDGASPTDRIGMARFAGGQI